MILTKFKNGKKTSYQITDSYTFEKMGQVDSQIEDWFSISVMNDLKSEKLKLLVILSPILIASFDKGSFELEFLKKTIEKSSFPYGLYPNFFKDLNKDKYFYHYKDWDKNSISEDIILNKDGRIDFYINPLPDSYLRALVVMVDTLIEDYSNRKELLKYFDKMRDDIVINGRRSIIANGIEAFYLNKYVVVWMLELIELIKTKKPGASRFLGPIFDLVSNLKTPTDIKQDQ